MSNGIALPGRFQIAVEWQDSPLAQPCVLTLNQPNGATLKVFGGMTKVELVAGQVAATLAADQPLHADLPTDLAAKAVDVAEAVLAECRRRVATTQAADDDEEGGE